MLVSSPFLPPRQVGETNDQYLDRVMTTAAAGNGGYPVSFEMNWHGGTHLTAPAGGSSVRAISDGEVTFLRKPTPRSTDPKHPLNYRGGWTDDGCVVLRHETDIGANAATSALTQVVFFSVYMHLSALENLSVGDDVFRKDKLGAAGSIYGVEHSIHLEVVCDDENVERLTGRTTAFSSATVDGRSDAIYGKLWFFCPLGSSFHESEPQPGRPLPPVSFTNADSAFLISMEFAGVDAIVKAHGIDGRQLGAEVTLTGFVSGLLDRTARFFPNSQSAGLELMRYGRVIGTDPLDPANAPNWVEVPHPGGSGFVDMNATGIKRMSDADFPSWDFGAFKRGWVLVDGGSSPDSRCKELSVIDDLDIDDDLIVKPEEAEQRLNDPVVQKSLGHKICKFPTEWDPATLDKRLSWLKDEKPPKLKNSEYQKLRKHVEALCFWTGSAPGIDGNHWHFHPREFIRHFRRCLWLSERELAQCIPRRLKQLSNAAFVNHLNATFAQARTRAGNWTPGLNLMLRKHLISESPERLTHFLAQVFSETGALQFVVEIRGAAQPYAPYFGRGLIQLSLEDNYENYGNYRTFPTNHPSANPVFSAVGWDPDDLIARSDAVFDAFNAADTAGYYWLNRIRNNNGLRRSDTGTALADIVSVSKYVNGFVAIQHVNGLDHRIGNFLYMKYILMDLVRPAANTERLTFTWRTSSVPPRVAGQHTVDFLLEHQKP